MNSSSNPSQVDAVICLDEEVYRRLREVIRHLCVGLVDVNARVRLISAYAQTESLSIGPVQTIVHQELSWPFRQKRLAQIIEALAVRKPTVIHAFSHGSYWLAQGLAAAFDVDLVVHLTSFDDIDELLGVTSDHLRAVIASTNTLETQAAEISPKMREAVRLVRMGFLRTERPSCFLREDGLPTVACTADFDQGNGVPELIRAVRILHDRGHELLLFLLGQGKQERELRKLVHQQEAAAYVTFARPRAETNSVLGAADIWVAPTSEKTLTSSSLAAMATGTAIVACSDGVPDHYVDGQTAIVCADPSPRNLAEAIESIILDRNGARTVGAQAMDYMKEHHSVSAMAEKTMAIYRDISMQGRTFSISEKPNNATAS